ncbi:HAMP domain-containing sensor histidine kinase [Streptomyces sp. CRN 30]|uniref:HAMP domain-containing sensor histidine kinase n=1 Tax=Streptomyces sp. CRN 30 TaxID=3075613 RepID=UPI002A80BAEE|nr:HAMP domain-containing sensor histidine kinase [Streptomyces sp. CRN 30]
MQFSLYWRIFLLNAAVLVVAVLLLLGPVTVSTPVAHGEALVIGVGLAAMLVVNAVLLRVGMAPLQRLTRAMATADLLRPGARPEVTGHGEIAGLTASFNAMLDRLESERATSSGRVLTALEGERRRIAQELHDEIGQTLTAVLLQIKHTAHRAPGPVREDLTQVQEAVRGSLEEIRRIARRLRPGVLEELGLHSALRALAAEFSTPGLDVRPHIAPGVPPLDPDTELVFYRVAQEGLTNIARHSGAGRADLQLRPLPQGGVGLLVRDDGKGIGGAPEGAGIRGMRERALLIGARLTVTAGSGTGTEVRLESAAAGTDAPRPGPGPTATGRDVTRAGGRADTADRPADTSAEEHGAEERNR